MRTMLRTLVLAVPLAIGVAPVVAQQERQAADTSSIDAEMKVAIAKARATLAQFWERFGKPGPGERGFTLKVAVPREGGTDHLWANDIERKDRKITAVITSVPHKNSPVRIGQRVEVAEGRISDWMYYRRDGKVLGAYTIRAMLNIMPSQDAARWRAILVVQ